ncbi:MAG: alpha/beta hydrolase [Anaerolineae bacterium]|nr:alpha/beta hydrolase [Anaerolineae bacterium]
MNKQLLRGFGIVLLIALTVATTLIILWLRPYPADNTAIAALQSTDDVNVTDTQDQIAFMPQGSVKAGFIFYPGALVSPEAYAKKMHMIAEQGYAVFIVKMPLNLAFFGANRADDVIAKHPEISEWAIGGHSLGGAMACNYVANSSKVQVLIFYAAYCDASFSLAGRNDVQVTSISGTKDGLATPAKIEQTKQFAPSTAVYVALEGANHAEFGDYGAQAGDGTAEITYDKATTQIVSATVDALMSLQ